MIANVIKRIHFNFNKKFGPNHNHHEWVSVSDAFSILLDATSKSEKIFIHTLKPRYSEQVRQTLFVHYNEWFTISNVLCLVNPQNGSWVLFTISRNSLYQGSLYRGLSVFESWTESIKAIWFSPKFNLLEIVVRTWQWSFKEWNQ